MLSSAMLCYMALVRTDIVEEYITSIIRGTRIGELVATLALTSNGSTLQRNTMYYVVHSISSQPALIASS
jgi:hypothetical protein